MAETAAVETEETSQSSTPRRGNTLSVEDFPFLDPKKFAFECVYPDCDKIFELTNNLYDHIRGHSKILECPLCQLKYKCMASLVYHVRTHSGSKPYICPLPKCAFVTATKGNLKAHLLSNHHKDAMTLPLLNCILAMDTKHSRPEMHLHGPRERKKRKLESQRNYGQIFTFQQPEQQLQTIKMISPSNALPPSTRMAFMQPQMTQQQVPLPVATPVYGTSSFYKNYHPVQKQQQQAQYIGQQPPMKKQRRQMAVPGPFAMPMIKQRRRINEKMMINLDNNQEVNPVQTFVQTKKSRRLFKPKQQSTYSVAEYNEDFTIRIKSNLLRSIEEAQNYRNINDVTDSDKFLQAIDGVESTKNFYAKSTFMSSKTNSDSATPALEDMMPQITKNESSESTINDDDMADLYGIAPPIVF